MSAPIYEPSAWGAKFHALKVDEALGAGSAGPGKTLVLLMDPLEQIVTENERTLLPKSHKNYLDPGQSTGWALHLRRTRTMLDQTIGRAQRIYPRIDPGVKWDAQRSTLKFSSGYRLQFGHCKDPDDYLQYYSSEFCSAAGTQVLMGDRSFKSIEQIAVGEEVMTLEGPRPVVATWKTGVKPCVEAVVRDRGAIVGTQRFPTTHPVLAATSVGLHPVPSQGSPNTVQRERPHGWSWQDYESRLYGAPESPVKRVSRVDPETGFVEFGGLHRDFVQLPRLSFPVVLHEPTLRRARSRLGLPNEYDGCAGWPEVSIQRYPGTELPRFGSGPDPSRAQLLVLPTDGHSGESRPCGDAGGQPDQGIATGFPAHCWSYSRLRGAQPRRVTADAEELSRLLGDAAGSSHSSSSADGRGSTRERSPCSTWSYPHFYSGESRVRSEDVRIGKVELRPVGFLETFDLTVEGANHYITDSALISSQTHLAFDELCQFLKSQYQELKTRVRSSDPILRKMLKIRSMSNPMVTHDGQDFTVRDPYWVRKLFVDPAPEGNVMLTKTVRMSDGSHQKITRMYLPARLSDNPDAAFRDDYERRLRDAPAHVRRALLEGDWYTIANGFYSDAWNPDLHVCDPFEIPSDWPKFRSMDWGHKVPGCIHWAALDPDDTLFVFREYTFQGKTARAVAERVHEIEDDLGLWKDGRSTASGPADTQLWEERGDSGRSKAEDFAAEGISWVPADKKSRRRNAERIIERLSNHGNGTTAPGIVFFRNCKQIIKTLPSMPRQEGDPETPMDGGDDHWHDSCCYLVSYVSRRDGWAKRDQDDDDDERDDKPKARRVGRGYGVD